MPVCALAMGGPVSEALRCRASVRAFYGLDAGALDAGRVDRPAVRYQTAVHLRDAQLPKIDAPTAWMSVDNFSKIDTAARRAARL